MCRYCGGGGALLLTGHVCQMMHFSFSLLIFSLPLALPLLILSLPYSPSLSPPIWQVQGLWMQQRSSSHDSNGLLGNLAGQGWTAGMAQILFPSLPLFIHLKASPFPLQLCPSLSSSPSSLTLATGHRSVLAIAPEISKSKD